jgi:UDP-N-acetylglucosamine acyltransferase
MKLLKYPKNLIIGKNNYIEKGVKILDNVIIGNNNKIYSGTIIYPNTKIGNNNVILDNNIIGEHPIEAKEIFDGKKFGGVEIGNNNFFHVNNLIFNGYYRKTLIGNNNKILADCHISHDTNIYDNVILYPRVTTGGITILMNYSTMGIGSFIQQNSVLGKYSMIGMGNVASHNVFPFFIYFNQKYLRFNKVKILFYYF